MFRSHYAVVVVSLSMMLLGCAQAQNRSATAQPAQIPANPPPATKLEEFKPAAGSIVTVGYDELGKVGGISVDVREMRDSKGAAVRGLSMSPRVVVPKQIIIISVRRTRAASTVTWRASTALGTSRRRFLAFQKPRQTTVANLLSTNLAMSLFPPFDNHLFVEGRRLARRNPAVASTAQSPIRRTRMLTCT